MKKIVSCIVMFFSLNSFAMTFDTEDRTVEELDLGDTIVACGESSCGEAEVVQKVTIHNKSDMQRILRNAQKLAVPGIALVVLSNMPTADGGPITGVVCAIACEVISNIGCGAGAWITATLNPAVGICYAAVCTALNSGAVTSCAAYCAALPTP